MRLTDDPGHDETTKSRMECERSGNGMLVKLADLWLTHILRRLIWVCTVCLCPQNGALVLYGLSFERTSMLKAHVFPNYKNMIRII